MFKETRNLDGSVQEILNDLPDSDEIEPENDKGDAHPAAELTPLDDRATATETSQAVENPWEHNKEEFEHLRARDLLRLWNQSGFSGSEKLTVDKLKEAGIGPDSKVSLVEFKKAIDEAYKGNSAEHFGGSDLEGGLEFFMSKFAKMAIQANKWMSSESKYKTFLENAKTADESGTHLKLTDLISMWNSASSSDIFPKDFFPDGASDSKANSVEMSLSAFILFVVTETNSAESDDTIESFLDNARKKKDSLKEKKEPAEAA